VLRALYLFKKGIIFTIKVRIFFILILFYIIIMGDYSPLHNSHFIILYYYDIKRDKFSGYDLWI
jgi:hypothetical protein